jgi:transcriptional accessory protein Tex/SPT6
MTEVLVERLVNSRSFDSSNATIDLLEKTLEITPAQAGRLLKAIEENTQVRGARTVIDRINKLIKRST